MTFSRKTRSQGRLDFWVCPNCHRRHDLIPPQIVKDIPDFPRLSLKCGGCGNRYDALEALDYQKQMKRKSMTSTEQLLSAIYENSEDLEDIRVRLVRIEHLLEQIEQK